jgi:hypothetical protein
VSAPRVLVWFSCGAASAVAGSLALADYGPERTELVYCDVSASEHPDNARFMRDVERWLGKTVTVIRSEDYATIDDVFERTRYMAGVNGARCTTEMKKVPRFAYQRPDDIHVFGLHAGEPRRIANLEHSNPELRFDWLLRDQGIGKEECLRRVQEAGIRIPAMYALGFNNNNCIGCVKATSADYWAKVRDLFPDVFARRAAQSRALGVRLARLNGERVFLDELPADDQLRLWPAEPQEVISCGPDCNAGAA